MEVLKQLPMNVSDIRWSKRLQLVALCGCFGIVEVMTWKGPQREDKQSSDSLSKSAGLDSRLKFAIMHLGTLSLLYYRYYKYKYCTMHQPKSSLETFEKIGFGAAFCGFFIRLYSKYTLGRHFVYTPSIQNSHTIVDNGLYAMVRHPGYTGMILYNVGCSIFMQSYWFSLLTVLNAHEFLKRIPKEEQLLLDNFPTKYRQYMQNVKYKLIPFIY
eukprot:786479_1